jgi:hypothetical protein
MEGIPKSIYDAKVHIEVQITDVEEGLDFLVHAPMGVVQKSQWRVAGKEGEWKLTIDTEIFAPRLVMSIVKGKGETNGVLNGRAFVQLLEG